MNVNTLTVGEIAQVENLAHAPMSHLGEDDKPQGLLMAAFAFVMRKRDNPDFTFDEALNLTIEDINNILGDDAVDPKA